MKVISSHLASSLSPSPSTASTIILSTTTKRLPISGLVTEKDQPFWQKNLSDDRPELKLFIHNLSDDPKYAQSDSRADSGNIEKMHPSRADDHIIRSIQDQTWDVPVALYQKMGDKAQQVWSSLQDEPMDHLPVSSLILPISLKSNPALAQTERFLSMTAKTTASEARTEPRYVTWQLRDTCKSEIKLIGFVVKTFDLNQSMVKQTFIETLPGDSSGCQKYKKPLTHFLPENSSDEGFDGFLSIAGVLEGQKEASDVIWKNLVRPQELAVDDHKSGLGSAKWGWPANDEPDLVGYRLYYGLTSDKYSHVVDLGLRTKYTVTALAPGKWYFALSAYNTKGEEGAVCNEISKEIVDEKK